MKNIIKNSLLILKIKKIKSCIYSTIVTLGALFKFYMSLPSDLVTNMSVY